MTVPSEMFPHPDELAEALRGVREDREHGASWLARETARALAEASHPENVQDATVRLDALHAAAVAFAAARPSMAAVANTAARVWAAVSSSATPSQARLVAAHQAAEGMLRTWDGSATAIAHAARPLLSGTLFTHSRSGTVESVLKLLAADGPRSGRSVIMTESRPGGEGVALAQSLAGAGWHVILIADAACGHFMPDAGTVVLGADSVREDGSLVNKIGSYLVALAARQARVPVYVLCETLKIAAPSFPLVYEEMDPGELLPTAHPNITPRNVYFDRTPADVITAVITERGVFSRTEIRQVAEDAAAALRALGNVARPAESSS